MNPYDFYITPDEYDIAKANGIDGQNLERRIRLLGWKKERALKEPLQKKVLLSVWAQLAREHGVTYDTFRSRIGRGMSKEQAATRPTQTEEQKAESTRKATEKKRVFPVEILELAEVNGIPYQTFYRRVTVSRWTLEKAATHPVMTPRETGKLTRDRWYKRPKANRS